MRCVIVTHRDGSRDHFGGGLRRLLGRSVAWRARRTVSVALEFRQGGQLVIQAELPGLDPHRDVRVWIASDVLHIRASREFVAEPAEHASDLRFGTFVRDIALPPGTIAEQVSARYRGTTLEIRVPLGQQRRLQRIEVPVLMLNERP